MDASLRKPSPVDAHVGARIRLRRKLLGLSQQQLAERLGLTFQQVQKYERGVNRVSASKLYETAQVLQASVTHFFEGLDGEAAADAAPEGETTVTAFLLTTEGMELAALFPRIPKGRMRHQVLELVRTLADFSEKLGQVMLDLACQLVRDGEGASKFVRIEVTGAKTPASARKIARTIAESLLVKTAIAGEDANWGRIVMAVGRADEPVRRERLSIRFGELMAAEEGAISPAYDEAQMSAYMKRPELEIGVDVGAGRASAVMWTCDLTKRYIEINGDYRS